ncbi:hypothetical protein INQ51_12350 [Maribellus sp. CM-23]|uniref:hypothetical protein n=1 Tax=Maribellus sp. CM-23 TaxID=2781026 RepID=UPI001F38302A|nr:hypothetical protein [Maribellus sp. CM-23]MCE4565101.1 hypothetical protein [Maribellus sp. CM-23]
MININKRKSLELYRKLVVNHKRNNNLGSFNNDGKDYALILMEEIFNACKKEILIFAKGLGGELASEINYVKALKKFVEKGGKVSVLVENNYFLSDKKSALFYLLQEKNSGNSNVSVRILKDGYAREVYSHFKFIHECNFLVGDDKITRIELKPNNFKAIANFHNVTRAKKLVSIFNKYFVDQTSEVLNAA